MSIGSKSINFENTFGNFPICFKTLIGSPLFLRLSHIVIVNLYISLRQWSNRSSCTGERYSHIKWTILGERSHELLNFVSQLRIKNNECFFTPNSALTHYLIKFISSNLLDGNWVSAVRYNFNSNCLSSLYWWVNWGYNLELEFNFTVFIVCLIINLNYSTTRYLHFIVNKLELVVRSFFHSSDFVAKWATHRVSWRILIKCLFVNCIST